MTRSGEIGKYPVFSLLVRVFPDENDRSLDVAPVYKTGVYCNDTFKLYDNEYKLMVDFYRKKRVTVEDVFGVVYPDLSKANEDIVKVSNNGKNIQKMMEFVDQHYFEAAPAEYVFDDLDSFQMTTIQGFSVSVDAIFDSSEDCKLG